MIDPIFVKNYTFKVENRRIFTATKNNDKYKNKIKTPHIIVKSNYSA